jgi:hypothetical protein
LSNWVQATDATIVVALLQPEPQTYDQFDDILLLSNGRIVYHGERSAVEPYFDSLGFARTDKKAVADFLQVCSTSFVRRWNSKWCTLEIDRI